MNQTTGTSPDIPILWEDNHLLVVRKPKNVLSQRDQTGDPDLLTLCREYLKNRYSKPGNAFLGLLHRLDRPVEGVMVLAKTSKAASRVSKQIRNRAFQKRYLAVVHGKTAPNGVLIHLLRKNPATKMSEISTVEDKKALKAELSYIRKDYNAKKELSLLQVNLITGRPHQIRVQFSASGHPLTGDIKYGQPDYDLNGPALFAAEVRFRHPVTGEPATHSSLPPDIPPWSWFNRDR